MTTTIVTFYLDINKAFKDWIANVDLFRGLSQEDRQDLINW